MENKVVLGKTIDTIALRDAVHIAVLPVTAGEDMWRGQSVRIIDPNASEIVVHSGPPSIGIIDPFLTGNVMRGQRVWLLLYPNTITSIRHDWTHPVFGRTGAVKAAEEWMREFAEQANLSYRDVMQAGRYSLADDSYFVQRGETFARDLMGDPATRIAYWKNFGILTGTAITEKQEEHPVFTCAC